MLKTEIVLKSLRNRIMKKTIAYRLLSFLLVSIVLTGCLNDLFEQEDQTYQGEAKLEFRPQTDTFDEDEGEIEVLVQLIGSQRGSDTSVGFSVSQDETTAESGTHYEIATTSPVTIPANASSASITINLNGSSLEEGDTETLVLSLDSGGEIEPAENLRTYTLTIEGVE